MTAVRGDPPETASPVPPAGSAELAVEASRVAGQPDTQPNPEPALTPSRVALLFVAWLAAILAGIGLVAYGIGPYNHERAQRHLLGSYRAEIQRAANEATGLAGVTVPSAAPNPGDPVAILEIGTMKLQEVVLEGVGPSQTMDGPGHVPGTAGPGQPGNSVVVGRRAAFGGVFRGLGDLEEGAPIVVTTRFGQSLYYVAGVETVDFEGEPDGDGPSVDDVYGPSDDDRLTLVTSASRLPWERDTAVVVTALMDGVPFAPTPQAGRAAGPAGVGSESAATAAVVLALLAYGAVMVATVLLYRRLSMRIAYLLAIAPVVAITVIAGETLARMFPAWG